MGEGVSEGVRRLAALLRRHLVMSSVALTLLVGLLMRLNQVLEIPGGGTLATTLVGAIALWLFPETGSLRWWPMGAVLACLLAAGLYLAWIPMIGQVQGRAPNVPELTLVTGWLTIAYSVVAVPWLEEKLVRHLMLEGLRKRVGFWPAVMISSLVFGATHGRYWLYTTLFGVVLAVAALTAGMTTSQRALAHGLVNLGILCWQIPGFVGYLV